MVLNGERGACIDPDAHSHIITVVFKRALDAERARLELRQLEDAPHREIEELERHVASIHKAWDAVTAHYCGAEDLPLEPELEPTG